MSASKRCDGTCERHRGEVRTVLVGGGGDYSEWDYCEAAVELDQRNGYRVFAEIAPRPAGEREGGQQE